MGVNQKIQQLELRLARADARCRCLEYMRDYLKELAQMPEDAVLSYNLSGMRVSHEIGKSARIALSMIEKSMK